MTVLMEGNHFVHQKFLLLLVVSPVMSLIVMKPLAKDHFNVYLSK